MESNDIPAAPSSSPSAEEVAAPLVTPMQSFYHAMTPKIFRDHEPTPATPFVDPTESHPPSQWLLEGADPVVDPKVDDWRDMRFRANFEHRKTGRQEDVIVLGLSLGAYSDRRLVVGRMAIGPSPEASSHLHVPRFDDPDLAAPLTTTELENPPPFTADGKRAKRTHHRLEGTPQPSASQRMPWASDRDASHSVSVIEGPVRRSRRIADKRKALEEEVAAEDDSFDWPDEGE